MIPLQTKLSRIDHYYEKYESEKTYQIEFWSESSDALIELKNGPCEMTLNHIEFIQCPALRKISISHLPETDFTKCPALEELEAFNCHCKILDLHTAPALRKLSCGYSGFLEELILTENNKL